MLQNKDKIMLFSSYFNLLIGLLCFGYLNGFAQNCAITIQGQIVDSHDHEHPLEFAYIFSEDKKIATISDENGTFTIKDVCVGEIHLVVSHLSCETQKFSLYVDKDTTIQLHLEHHAELLSMVTITSKKDEEDISQAKATLTGKTLERVAGKSLGASLESIAGVTTLKTGPGIAKPVIHGLFGNRILTVNNGIRQEGQQWGNEHAPEIDPFTAAKISVIKGAAAVKYGPDALSGVVLVEPAPFPSDEHLHGSLNLVGLSNGRQGVASLKLEGGLHPFETLKWRVQGSYKKAGDAQTPNYSLTNTGNEEKSFSAAFRHKTAKMETELYGSYFNAEIGILRGAHIGNLTDLENALNREEPFYTTDFSYDIQNPKQAVAHILAKAKNTIYFEKGSKIVTTYGFQNNHRQEFDIRRGNRYDIPALDLNIQTHTLDVAFQHRRLKKMKGEIGIGYRFQNNRNIAGTGVSPLIPNFVSYRPGIYILEKWRLKKWELEAGLRYDYQWLQAKFFNDNDELEKPIHEFNIFAGNIGASFKSVKNFNYRVNFGTAYRAPNANELYSDGLHHGAAAIEEGDANLDIEKSYKIINTFTYSNEEKFNLEASLHYNYLDDYIYLQPEAEPRLTIRGAFPVFGYKQTVAEIFGADIAGRLQLKKHFYWESKASLIRGNNISDDQPLILMPSDQWKNSLSYIIENIGRWQDIEFIVSGLQVWEQKRVAGELDLAPPPPSYFLTDFEVSTRILMKAHELKFHVAIRNAFDLQYRSYLNRLRYYADDTGQNVELRIKYIF